ncbi:MAG TPA: hypothetical protein VM144_11350 [Aestuariivirga sp.]|nr:hypothetical protein [Aestuariivirga sp.]
MKSAGPDGLDYSKVKLGTKTFDLSDMKDRLVVQKWYSENPNVPGVSKLSPKIIAHILKVDPSGFSCGQGSLRVTLDWAGQYKGRWSEIAGVDYNPKMHSVIENRIFSFLKTSYVVHGAHEIAEINQKLSRVFGKGSDIRGVSNLINQPPASQASSGATHTVMRDDRIIATFQYKEILADQSLDNVPTDIVDISYQNFNDDFIVEFIFISKDLNKDASIDCAFRIAEWLRNSIKEREI